MYDHDGSQLALGVHVVVQAPVEAMLLKPLLEEARVDLAVPNAGGVWKPVAVSQHLVELGCKGAVAAITGS